MIVACLSKSGKVVGFSELDCRDINDPKLPPRPYMCNLAVDRSWKRKGIAKALVRACESRALSSGKNNIHLKVREKNVAAVKMYGGMGYTVRESIQEQDNLVLLMTKELVNDDVGRHNARNQAITLRSNSDSET